MIRGTHWLVSSGHKGFKGSRKSTPYAAQIAAEDVGNKAKEFGLKILKLKYRGLDQEENPL